MQSSWIYQICFHYNSSISFFVLFCSNKINTKQMELTVLSCFRRYLSRHRLLTWGLKPAKPGPVRWRIGPRFRPRKEFWSVLGVNPPTQSFATSTITASLSHGTSARHVGVIGQEVVLSGTFLLVEDAEGTRSTNGVAQNLRFLLTNHHFLIPQVQSLSLLVVSHNLSWPLFRVWTAMV